MLRRVVVVTLGLALLLGGVPLLVTRGPGLPMMFLGAAMLLYEFKYARRRTNPNDAGGPARLPPEGTDGGER